MFPPKLLLIQITILKLRVTASFCGCRRYYTKLSIKLCYNVFNALYPNVQISPISNLVEEDMYDWFRDRDVLKICIGGLVSLNLI